MKYPVRGTPFTDRISANGTGATGVVVLTINNVQVQDGLEFICSVQGLTEGVDEGRTKLKVFGKIQSEMEAHFKPVAIICLLMCKCM